MEAVSSKFRNGLPWELVYADYLILITYMEPEFMTGNLQLVIIIIMIFNKKVDTRNFKQCKER